MLQAFEDAASRYVALADKCQPACGRRGRSSEIRLPAVIEKNGASSPSISLMVNWYTAVFGASTCVERISVHDAPFQFRRFHRLGQEVVVGIHSAMH
jgi:hypothetical protein